MAAEGPTPLPATRERTSSQTPWPRQRGAARGRGLLRPPAAMSRADCILRAAGCTHRFQGRQPGNSVTMSPKAAGSDMAVLWWQAAEAGPTCGRRWSATIAFTPTAWMARASSRGRLYQACSWCASAAGTGRHRAGPLQVSGCAVQHQPGLLQTAGGAGSSTPAGPWQHRRLSPQLSALKASWSAA